LPVAVAVAEVVELVPAMQVEQVEAQLVKTGSARTTVRQRMLVKVVHNQLLVLMLVPTGPTHQGFKRRCRAEAHEPTVMVALVVAAIGVGLVVDTVKLIPWVAGAEGRDILNRTQLLTDN
jgi:hypothetical protein